MSRTKQGRKQSRIPSSVKINIALIAVFFLLLFWGGYLMRDKLLMNANEMGTYLAQSYAAEEENRMSVYQLLLRLGAFYLEGEIEKNTDRETLQEWMAQYSENISDTLEAVIIDPFAVIDGKIVAADPWDGDGEYDFESTEWYQKALAAEGEIIYTDAYRDAITGKQIVTIAKQLGTGRDVFSFDILLENFHIHKNRADIPESSTYFLFDGSGQLLYAASDSETDFSAPEAQEYVNRLLRMIQSGSLENYTSSIRDLSDRNRGVYYYYMDNGWLSVITIPLKNILQDGWNGVIIALAVIGLALVLTLAGSMIREYLGERMIKHTSDTLKILGDTFYAIYRVNYEEGTYETVKSSDDVKGQLGRRGTYEHLLQVVKEVVEERVYEEFEHSFSLNNIHRLVENQIFEYGGDYQRKFGEEYKWVSIKIIYNRALNLNEVIMCFREIDTEKRMQLQNQLLLENALNTAKQAAQKKNVFFSNVSHDMRTPLNAIIGLTGLARGNEGDPEKQAEYIDKIGQAGRQLLTLVNDVLDLSRIEQKGESSMNYAPTDLKECVQSAAAMFDEQAVQEGKRLSVMIDAEESVVYCDEFRISQILNNLISNAVKYSRSGDEITVELKLMSRQGKSGKYQIVVRDTGIGMSKEFLGRIFEPFSRETIFSPARITGTGLGMPIVKSLVQQMSGEIMVESELGRGSKFTVTLPFTIADQTEDVKPVQVKESGGEESFTLTGKRILVAEDNEINMEIMTECLTMAGAQVIQAWNGAEAAELFGTMEEGSVDVILMDMQMPELDGCEACERIRGMDRADAKTVPIIAVTANAFAEDIARTTKAGMNGHIAKPIDFKVLMEMLQKIVRERKNHGG